MPTSQDHLSKRSGRTGQTHTAARSQADRSPVAAAAAHAPFASPTVSQRRIAPLPASGPGKTSDKTTTGRSGGSTLDPSTRSFLEPRFGHNLGNIRIFSDAQADRLSSDFGAAAFTVGQDIFFARGNYDPGSPMGQRLLTHEVAHAVQQRGVRPAAGSGFDGLDIAKRGSRSETEAHAATDAVLRGNPVSLSASSAPVISRWESGEHKHAVDDATSILAEAGQQVDPAVQSQMAAKIKLANGLEVTPGHITAMMGDLYGRFDPKTGDFDPAKSFEQMNNADPEEMAKLIHLIDEEAKTRKPADAAELEKITRNRKNGDDPFIELAEKNDSHFSAPNADGTNNNMGAYSAFHKMALEKAEQGDMNTARALEASAGHYLTDRFSAGHNFEKKGVMDASGFKPGGILANMAVKTAHDDMNKNGISVNDATGGPGWKAFGDNNWNHEENAENRQHTAQAVYGSWSELEKVHAHQVSAADLEKGGFGAFTSVPQFDPKNQERAEAVARHTSRADILWDYKGQALDGAAGKFWHTEGQVENKIGDAYDWTANKAHQAWNAVGKAASWAGKKVSSGVEAVEDEAIKEVRNPWPRATN